MFDVIVPMVDNRYESLSEFLSEGYDGDKIVADWSRVEEIQADKKAQTDLVTRQVESMLITPYQGAKILFGDEMPKNPPPDEYFRKSSLVPVESTEETPEVVTPDMIRQLAEEAQNNGGNGNGN